MSEKLDKTGSNIFNFIKKHKSIAGEKVIDEFDLSGAEYDELLIVKLRDTFGLIEFGKGIVFLSEKGESHKSFKAYQKSLNKKQWYNENWVGYLIASIVLLYNAYQFLDNRSLKNEYEHLNTQYENYKDSIYQSNKEFETRKKTLTLDTLQTKN